MLSKNILSSFIRKRIGKSKEEKSKYEDVEKLKEYLGERNLIKERKVKRVHPFVFFFFRFPVHVMRALIRTRKIRDYKILSNALFGEIALIYPNYFEPLKNAVDSSDIDILPESYIGLMTAAAFVVSIITTLIVLAEGIILGLPVLWVILGLLIMPFTAFITTFTLFYIYPFNKVKAKRKSIETNLAFATNHMAAIAASGVPPEKAFKMLTEFKEYGAISKEAREITKRIEVFGEDITKAVHHVASRTPSQEFKDLLYGILSVIESGGNLKEYLNKMAEDALFNYKLRRKRYLETISTYADIYTAILIAAPLFLVAILAVISLVPGSTVGGLSVDRFMALGVYIIIPLLNVAFLLFVNYTQPEA